MKKLICFFAIALSLAGYGQEISGQWNGVLSFQGMQLRVVFNINKTDAGYTATMDSPDQGAKGIPVTSTTFADSKVMLSVANAGLVYEGVLGDDGIIVGNLNQGGQSLPMNLSKGKVEIKEIAKPQEPKQPYPYISEDLTFKNTKANIKLAGTLTLPKKKGVFPAVILISGSGAQDRNEELMGHKPFLVLSDYFTRNGYAVLRFDDRGTALSEGDFLSATSADFATDVEAGIEYLKTRKEIDKTKIGLIGHSEGGLIAAMIASRSKDINYIVLLAGTGVSGDKILLSQQNTMGSAYNMGEENLKKIQDLYIGAFDIVRTSTGIEQLKIDLTNYFKKIFQDNPNFVIQEGVSNEDYMDMMVNQLATPWMQFFIKYDPAQALEKVKCSVLALNGEKDMQVTPKENLSAIKQALDKGGNKKYTIKELPQLNHLFQECETGSPVEYATIEQTFSPKAMEEILSWMKTQ